MITNKLECFMKERNNEQRLCDMDSVWAIHGGGCFELCMPSFRCTHTEQEVEEYTKREIAKLKKMMKEYEEKLVERK